MDGLLSDGADASATVVAASVLAVALASPFVWLHLLGYNHRTAWIVAGLAGIPAAFLATFYFIGLPLLLVTGAASVALDNGRRSTRIVPALIVVTALVGSAASTLAFAYGNDHPDDWFISQLFVLSSAAALLCAAKLGRMFAGWRRGPRDRGVSESTGLA